MTAAADSDRTRRLYETAEANLPEIYSEFSLETLGGGYLHDGLLVTHPEGLSVYKALNTDLDFAAIPIPEVIANTRRAGETGVGARLITGHPREEYPADATQGSEKGAPCPSPSPSPSTTAPH